MTLYFGTGSNVKIKSQSPISAVSAPSFHLSPNGHEYDCQALVVVAVFVGVNGRGQRFRGVEIHHDPLLKSPLVVAASSLSAANPSEDVFRQSRGDNSR